MLVTTERETWHSLKSSASKRRRKHDIPGAQKAAYTKNAEEEHLSEYYMAGGHRFQACPFQHVERDLFSQSSLIRNAQSIALYHIVACTALVSSSRDHLSTSLQFRD